MELHTIQYMALCVSVSLMLLQLFVRDKQTVHILFAVFCGSIAMSIVKGLSSDAIGMYQYIIGMAACATCNCFWLLSRSLFRGEGGIKAEHVIFAGIVALLIVANQGYLFAFNAALIEVTTANGVQVVLRELTVLMSSCILVLSFWEGCRGFTKHNTKERAQRVFFLCTFSGAVVAAKFGDYVFTADALSLKALISIIIVVVLVNTQILILLRATAHKRQAKETTPAANSLRAISYTQSKDHGDGEFATQVKALIVESNLFLQPNLKIADIARLLDVSEYKVSQVFRHNFKARNFNQYINEMRVQHAKTLLADESKQGWSVLVVGLESGFASVGPFSRAFKAYTGCTPNQYRQARLMQLASD